MNRAMPPHQPINQITVLLYIYIETRATLDSFFNKNAIYILFPRRERALRAHLGGPVEPMWSSASPMSVQLQSRTPSVDPAVENYFCNAVHLV